MSDLHNARIIDQSIENSDVDHRSTVRIPTAATDATTPMPLKRPNRPNLADSQSLPQNTSLPRSKWSTLSTVLIIFLGIIETLLILISLVPATFSTRLGWSATNGPFPVVLAPLVTIVYYGVPTVIGFLAKRWDIALLGASAPAWIGIGASTIASSSRDGYFAMTHDAQPTYLVGTLELFAFLGLLGWIARCVLWPPQTARNSTL